MVSSPPRQLESLRLYLQTQFSLPLNRLSLRLAKKLELLALSLLIPQLRWRGSSEHVLWHHWLICFSSTLGYLYTLLLKHVDELIKYVLVSVCFILVIIFLDKCLFCFGGYFYTKLLVVSSFETLICSWFTGIITVAIVCKYVSMCVEKTYRGKAYNTN